MLALRSELFVNNELEFVEGTSPPPVIYLSGQSTNISVFYSFSAFRNQKLEIIKEDAFNLNKFWLFAFCHAAVPATQLGCCRVSGVLVQGYCLSHCLIVFQAINSTNSIAIMGSIPARQGVCKITKLIIGLKSYHDD